VLIDSISPRRAPTAGRPDAAEQMDRLEWAAFRDRIAHVAKMGAEEYGLTVGIHAHAAGFMDFEPELERLLDEVPEDILKICFDTGHHSYAGFDPVAFMKQTYRPHVLHAFQGHRPRSEGRRDRQPAPGSTRPAGRASSAISGRATSISPPCGRSCSTTVSKAGARSSRIAIRRSMSRPSTTRANRAYLNPSGSEGRPWHD
jgi:hypothetical protein